MLISVIIPTCDRAEALAQCLGRILPGACGSTAADVEIIVSDDSRAGDGLGWLKQSFPNVKWAKGPGKGPAANRNCGARLASGEWLVFTDDDCLPEPEWLGALFHEMSCHSGVDVLEGVTLPVGEKSNPLDDAPVNDRGGMLWSCNMAVRRELFFRLGGFDERFPYAAMEDVDFRERLLKTGAGCSFVTAAVVRHPWKPIDVLEHTRKHAVSTLIYVRLNPDRSAILRIRHVVGVELRVAAKKLVREFRRWPLKSIHALVMRMFCMVYRIYIYERARE